MNSLNCEKYNSIQNLNNFEDEIKQSLVEFFGEKIFSTWFENVDFVINANSVNFVCKSNSILSWIENSYGDKIKSILVNKFNLENVQYSLNLPLFSNNKFNPLENKEQKFVKKIKDDEIEFITSKSNILAFNSIKYLIENFQKSIFHGKILHFFGDSFCGKTFCLKYLEFNLKKNEDVAFFSGIDFINLYSRSVKEKSVNEFRSFIMSKKFLIIDNIDAFEHQKGTLKEFSRLCGSFLDLMKCVIVSSKFPINDLPKDIIQSCEKLNSALSIKIENPCDEIKLKISNKFALEENVLNLVDINSIIKNSKSIDEIKSKIAKIKITNSFGNLSLFEEFTQKKEEMSKKDIAMKIINFISESLMIDNDKIISRGGGREVTSAKYIAMYIIRLKTDLTTNKIASIFNLKSHTNITKGIKLLQSNPNLLELANKLIKDLNL